MPEQLKAPAVWLLLILQFVCFATALSAEGMPVVVECEPNDQPQRALPFSAPVILIGSMYDYDQDAFLRQISDFDALQRWNLTLHGIPETPTGNSIVRINYDSNPNATVDDAEEVVLGTGTLLTFGIRDGSRPVTRQNNFFPAGDYVVGFFQAGASSGYKAPCFDVGSTPVVGPTEKQPPLNLWRRVLSNCRGDGST